MNKASPVAISLARAFAFRLKLKRKPLRMSRESRFLIWSMSSVLRECCGFSLSGHSMLLFSREALTSGPALRPRSATAGNRISQGGRSLYIFSKLCATSGGSCPSVFSLIPALLASERLRGGG